MNNQKPKGKPNFQRNNSKKGGQSQKESSPSKQASKTIGIRLNKFIAHAGICSRRDADTHISVGNVTVNGEVVTKMGYRVNTGDQVRFDGRIIKAEKPEYLLLNKPKGFISTTRDEKARKTVMDLIANASRSRLVPVGRLDRPTTGLLLFTNDGDLAKKLSHPSGNVRKIYHVVLDQKLTLKHFNEIKTGITLSDGLVEVDEISWIPSTSKHEIGIKIHSGKNRIIRRLFDHLGYAVTRLDRVVFAGLTKKDLPRGHWRHLTKQEVINLKML